MSKGYQEIERSSIPCKAAGIAEVFVEENNLMSSDDIDSILSVQSFDEITTCYDTMDEEFVKYSQSG